MHIWLLGEVDDVELSGSCLHGLDSKEKPRSVSMTVYIVFQQQNVLSFAWNLVSFGQVATLERRFEGIKFFVLWRFMLFELWEQGLVIV